jgi:hypothetical protein
MARAARVTSIDAVREMAIALRSFRTEMVAGMDEIETEVRRALEWIHQERKQYWDGEARRAVDRVTEARVQLQQAQTAKRMGDHEPSCHDEKKALQRAKLRWELTERKKEFVRHWQQAIDHAVSEYRAPRTQLAGWLDAEAPRGLAVLERLSQALESYVALEAAVGGAGPTELPAVAPTDEAAPAAAGEPAAAQPEPAQPAADGPPEAGAAKEASA